MERATARSSRSGAPKQPHPTCSVGVVWADRHARTVEAAQSLPTAHTNRVSRHTRTQWFTDGGSESLTLVTRSVGAQVSLGEEQLQQARRCAKLLSSLTSATLCDTTPQPRLHYGAMCP